jgi:hypothetical protein
MRRSEAFSRMIFVDEMHWKNTKDSGLAINHGNVLSQFAGVFSCFWGAAWFFGFAIFIRSWKPVAVVQTIGSLLVFLVMLCVGIVGVLVGLRLILGPDGVTIDPKRKEITVWRRTLRLNIKKRVFEFEQLKQIKIAIRKKSGTFGADYGVYSVVAGNEPNEVELDYFSTITDAKALAKRVAEASGLQFIEYDHG